MKNYRIYLITLLTLFVGYVLVEYYRPRPVDWRESYSNRDKIPYGTRALFELLPDMFGDQTVTTVRTPIYNVLKGRSSSSQSSYVFINQKFTIDKNDLKQLLSYVNQGNTVFIAASELSPLLRDTLNVEVIYPINTSLDIKISGEVNFVNPRFRQANPYVLQRGNTDRFFRFSDSLSALKATALGTNGIDSVNFVSIRYGKGRFLLHAEPRAFCNFSVVPQSTSQYAFKALSYLPRKPILWDEYQKKGPSDDQSVFRVIYRYPPLKWAFYLAISGILLFIFFEGKRRQRVIPIIERPQNTSQAFVETISRLYFQQQNHQKIAEKKISHFLQFVRQRYGIPTQDLNDDFVLTLSVKTGQSSKVLFDLVNLIEQTRQGGSLTEDELIKLNQKIEDFYRNA